VKCFPELVQYGAQDVLQREYGPYIVEPESGYDFSVVVDLDGLPAEQGRFILMHYGTYSGSIALTTILQAMLTDP